MTVDRLGPISSDMPPNAGFRSGLNDHFLRTLAVEDAASRRNQTIRYAFDTRPSGIISDASPSENSWKAGQVAPTGPQGYIGEGLKWGTRIGGAALSYFSMTGAAGTYPIEGIVPGRLDVQFRREPIDTNAGLTVSQLLPDGSRQLLYSGRPDADSIYRTEDGLTVARLPGEMVPTDPPEFNEQWIATLPKAEEQAIRNGPSTTAPYTEPEAEAGNGGNAIPPRSTGVRADGDCDDWQMTNPPKSRLPRSEGRWDGEPGNSNWYSNKPEVNA